MDKLTKIRGNLKSRVTMFKNYIAQLINSLSDITQSLDETKKLMVIERLKNIRDVYKQYNEVQLKIDELTPIEEESLTYRENFEEEYFNSVAQAECLLARGLATQIPNASINDQREFVSVPGTSTQITGDESNFIPNFARQAGQNIVFKTPGIRLPTIELPKFKGDIDEWLGFRDTFESLIHNNDTIAPIQKFHYLKAALDGTASQIIKSLEFSAANYAIAWETISKRFDDKGLLTHNHIKAIFSINTMKEESAIQIRNATDTLNKHLRALNVLGQSTEHWDALLIYIISGKLDNITAREWEKEKADKELPTLDDFKEFLNSRANLLDKLELTKRNAYKVKQPDHIKSKSLFIQKTTCIVCKETHHLASCPKFLQLSQQKRIEVLKNAKLCLNCMKSGHFIKNCKSSTCKKCSGKHNTLIHFEKLSEQQSEETEKKNISASVLYSLSTTSDYQVLLSTATVLVEDKHSKMHKIRVILDPGSQSSLITNALCEKLQLNKTDVNINIEAVNNASFKLKHECKVNVAERYGNYNFQLSCLVVPEITGALPSAPIDIKDLQIPTNIKLADPQFHVPAKVDMLLGADCFWNLLCVGQLRLGPSQLLMQKTCLGWIAAGPFIGNKLNSVRCHLNKTVDLHTQVAKFWELDEFFEHRRLSQEERECENHFVQTIKRDTSGRFIVHIPFKANPNNLGNSYDRALRRLHLLEGKLQRNQELKKQYVTFLTEYEQLGHMSKVINWQDTETTYYMPHHGVIREDSTTTKLRVVFDASAITHNGTSLNHIQMVGPTWQEDLFSILLRFRMHTYVISSDIEKMYRQVLVTPEQRPLQRILWRQDPNDPVEVYQLNTVTYGTASAPYLAKRCLLELANDCEQQQPNIAQIIRQDFYVDDLLTGANSVEAARNIVRNVSQILSSAGFKLRKWLSNEDAIIEEIPASSKNENSFNFDGNNQTKILGLFWQAHQDTLGYSIKHNSSVKVSKRQILSDITQVFDPLGLIGPCFTSAKIILQKLWMHKLSWDETLPAELHSTWTSFRGQLHQLQLLKLPRHVMQRDYSSLELHGFADASQQAYGACVYVRSFNNQEVQLQLLCSKGRVAPLKTQTIPRLELCAALTLARLMKKLTMSLNVSFNKIVYWSDSTVVLSWLRTQPNQLQVFVSNRVAEIQELTDCNDWRHVPTQDNPADLLSRGLTPNQLLSAHMWWNGPAFLKKLEDEWPINPTLKIPTIDVRKNACTLALVQPMKINFFEITNDLNRLIRIVAYCRRFIDKYIGKYKLQSGPLTTIERRDALYSLARLSQKESFRTEIETLDKNNSISKGRLSSLNPFLDEKHILRVGGRLKHSCFSIYKKHPIVLSADHQFTNLLFANEHLRLLHAGPQLLLSSIRDQFWPIGGRNLARKTVRQCIKCFKNKPQSSQTPIGDLPKERISVASPFNNSGVDYAGPFNIKDRKGRGCKVTKAYVCLFICFATKAIHLELVSDLTAEAFIAALRRFSSRRGKPAQIYSDNGKNFVKANKELKSLAQFLKIETKTIETMANEIGIGWHFIPAYSPHFGGLWEAGVKSTKYHLKRIAGNETLTFEEFYTLLTQIEALLNSRPLTPMSSDPNDLTPLTPAHFLVGHALTSVPDPALMNEPVSKLSRWQLIQRLQQHFWTRWSKEYLSELQQRVVKKDLLNPIKEDTMVLIKDNNLPTLRWKLGRVIDIYPGIDNIARVATVKTSTGNLRIATVKLCPLPISENSCDI